MPAPATAEFFKNLSRRMSRTGAVLRLTHENAPTVRKSRGANQMKYILMMNCPRTGYDSFGSWPKEAIRAHLAFMHGINKALKESAEFVSAEGLASPHEAKRVRAGKDGAPITDGVFPETKEYLAGYWIVDVAKAPSGPMPLPRERRRRPVPAASR
jgi:hypothetical protein